MNGPNSFHRAIEQQAALRALQSQTASLWLQPSVLAGAVMTVTEKHIRHYETRAQGDVGMVILQSILVNHDHPSQDCYASIYQDSQIHYLSCPAETPAQIPHGGDRTTSLRRPDKISPRQRSAQPRWILRRYTASGRAFPARYGAVRSPVMHVRSFPAFRTILLISFFRMWTNDFIPFY